VHPHQALLGHEPGDPLASATHPPLGQLAVHSGGAIGPPGTLIDIADGLAQRLVRLCLLG
jgi:hypothetical protein